MRKTLAALPIAVAALVATAPLFAPASAAGPDGAMLFRQRCGSCHVTGPGARATLAPNLAGVLGRKAGTGVFNYSPALKASNLTWTRANLDRFLQGPARMVPGTRMVVSVPDAAQRAAILNHIARLPAR